MRRRFGCWVWSKSWTTTIDPPSFGGHHLPSLLIALARQCGEPVSSDRLVEILWEADLPSDSANALQRHVCALRRLLGAPELVQRRGPGDALALEPTAVDALWFEALVRKGRAAITSGDFATASSSVIGGLRTPVRKDERGRIASPP